MAHQAAAQVPTRMGPGISCQEMGQQAGAHPLALSGRVHVGVADQGDVLEVLAPHHSHQARFSLVAPEVDPRGHLGPELRLGHIGLVPAIRRDHPFIGQGGLVDDLQGPVNFIILERPNPGIGHLHRFRGRGRLGAGATGSGGWGGGG